MRVLALCSLLLRLRLCSPRRPPPRSPLGAPIIATAAPIAAFSHRRVSCDRERHRRILPQELYRRSNRQTRRAQGANDRTKTQTQGRKRTSSAGAKARRAAGRRATGSGCCSAARLPVAVQPTVPPVAVRRPAAPAQQPANNFQTARALILSGKYEAGIAAMKALGYDDHPDDASSIGYANARLGNLAEARVSTTRRSPPIPITRAPGPIPARSMLRRAISPRRAAILIASRPSAAARPAPSISNSKA